MSWEFPGFKIYKSYLQENDKKQLLNSKKVQIIAFWAKINRSFNIEPPKNGNGNVASVSLFAVTCSNSTIDTLEKGVLSVVLVFVLMILNELILSG